MAEKYLEFEQDGVKYNLYDMPKGFVVKGDLDLSNKGLTELPDLSDVVVEGNFDCSGNELTTLKGAPKKVGGHFDCFENELTTLEGAPKEVGGDFECKGNRLKSLLHLPKMKEEGRIYCDDTLEQKYGISHDEFTANELNESSLYQNEVKIYKLRLQKSQERAEKEDKAVADIKARFAAWQAQQAQKDGLEK
ncbi:MAG: hypothetical protein IJ770_05430 [Alphaproteobacteria bacterium]|nr:hypothetical protein [Alphaproteobacteria bacterium]